MNKLALSALKNARASVYAKQEKAVKLQNESMETVENIDQVLGALAHAGMFSSELSIAREALIAYQEKYLSKQSRAHVRENDCIVAIEDLDRVLEAYLPSHEPTSYHHDLRDLL